MTEQVIQPVTQKEYDLVNSGVFDYRNPPYNTFFRVRADRLRKLRDNPENLPVIRRHYQCAPWDFINDWGMTFDPRAVERGQIANMPFILWPRQKEYLKWVFERWKGSGRGLVEKSRDCGVTWLSVGMAVSLWSFHDGVSLRFGSRKEDLVDRIGDPDSIFEKIRHMLRNLPDEFLPQDWSEKKYCSHMKVVNPHNGSTIAGEAGDNIGRGGRASIYFVDEAAFIERQERVDAALSQTTNCQIDISTPFGPTNNFAKKRIRYNNTDRVFIFDWRDDPRKDQPWYDRQCEDLDEVTVAQEIDRDYNASAEDSVIPAKWVNAAIDAHKTLGFEPQGIRVTGFDPADIGDFKAIVNRYGSVVTGAEQKKTGTIVDAIPWAFEQADNHRADVLSFDGDGMGAPTMKVALTQRSAGRMKVTAYHGSAGVMHPNQEYGKEGRPTTKKIQRVDVRNESLHKGVTLRKNVDRFQNFRAQTWTWVRDRFEATYNAVTRARKGMIVNIDPENLISISSDCTDLEQLKAELSSPKRLFTPNGKIKIESKKQMRDRGVSSPNLADALVISFATNKIEPQKPKIKLRQRNIQDHSLGY